MVADWLAPPEAPADPLALPGEPTPPPPPQVNIDELPDHPLPLSALTREEKQLVQRYGDMPEVSERSLARLRERVKEREEFANAWASLKPRQKMYLRALQQTGFSQTKALKILEESDGERINRGVATRWAKQNANFAFVLEALKIETARQVTTREDLLMRAHRIAEQAEEGEPVFGADRETGLAQVIGYEKKLDTALRANEQLMKATKVLGGDVVNPFGAGTGPALVIQVVGGDGSVKDVTPKGVTIDMPVPDGA